MQNRYQVMLEAIKKNKAEKEIESTRGEGLTKKVTFE